jgi:hypothetical protein
MGFIDKLFKSGVKDTIDSVGNAIDKIVTSDEERGKLRNELTEIVTDKMGEVIEAQKEILVTEMGGNWLQRSWRPIIMLSFGFIVFYHYFISQVFNTPTIDLPDMFWDLLHLGIGGYVIGRSVEKIADKVSNNVTIKKR